MNIGWLNTKKKKNPRTEINIGEEKIYLHKEQYFNRGIKMEGGKITDLVVNIYL